LEVLAINRGQRAEEVAAFGLRLGLSFPLLVNEDASVYRLYNGERAPRVAPFPRDVVVDPEGRVAYFSALYEPHALSQTLERMLSGTGVRRRGQETVPRDLEVKVLAASRSGQVEIEFYLPMGTDVRLRIVDALGRTVAELDSGYRPAGAHRLSWSGCTAQGFPLPNGVYLCHLRAGSRSAVARFILCR
jgi:hypothetical protein